MVKDFKKNFKGFQIGQILETIKPIYPEDKTKVKFEGRFFSKPLALGKKNKTFLKKENENTISFFKDFTVGDLLKVVKVENNFAYCLNISKNNDTFYKEKEIKISDKEIMNNIVRIYEKELPQTLLGGTHG